MNILFLCLSLPDIDQRGSFYADLIIELENKGHNIYALCSTENGMSKGMSTEHGVKVLRVNVPFLRRNTSLLRKGIGSLMINPCFCRAYKKHYSKITFDWLMLPTPPPTMVEVVETIKKSQNPKVYVILRDIQPESGDRTHISPETLNRTDVYEECKKPHGFHPIAKRLLYNKSQALYKIADIIGCMTPGNAAFVKKIAPYVDDNKLKVLPNWYAETKQVAVDEQSVREKYNLKGKFVAIFGGNIGPQQAVWNIAQLAKMNINKKDVVFLVVGRGVAKHTLEDMARRDNLTNMMFLEYMPREDYESVLQTADIGIISLDEKYQVPTCPSKVIGYMALSKPVLAMFNKGSDYGEFYIDNPGCGLWSVDLDHNRMQDNFEWFYSHPKERKQMGVNGYNYYKEHFSAERICELLDNQLKSISM